MGRARSIGVPVLPSCLAASSAVLFAAVTLAAVAAASPAAAAGWSQASSYAVSGGPVAASAAPGAIAASGWRDVNGQVWSVSPASQLIAGALASPWNTGELVRPAPDAEVDVQASAQLVLLASGTAGSASAAVYDLARYTKSAGATNAYAVGADLAKGQLAAFRVVAGALTAIGSATTFTPAAVGAGYALTTSVVQTSATTTTLTATLSSGGSPVASASWTDTTASLQNVLGPPGLFSFTSNGASVGIASLATSADAAPAVTLPVSSAAFRFAPAVWKGDTGRGGSAWRQSWNNGAWFTAVWTAGPSPSATLLLPSGYASNRLSYFLNGILTDNVAASGPLTLQGLAANATNTLSAYLRNSTQSGRWNNGANVVQVQGLQLDGGSTAGTAPVARPWVLIVGDSITEGIQASAGADDSLLDYSFLLGQALEQAGYDYGVSACGFSGWLRTGDSTGDVPAYYAVSGSSGGSGGAYSEAASRWDKIDQGVSLLDANGQISGSGQTGTPPAAILINYMTNEALNASNLSDAQASVTQAITALRSAAPHAQILILTPFGLEYAAKYPSAYVTALRQGVAAYQAAHPGDVRVRLVDLGPGLAATLEASGSSYLNADAVHPNASGHALLAALVTQQVTAALAPAGARLLGHH